MRRLYTEQEGGREIEEENQEVGGIEGTVENSSERAKRKEREGRDGERGGVEGRGGKGEGKMRWGRKKV